MNCKRLRRASGPAPIFHRWLCADCRAATRADGIIALGLACLRAELAPADGLSRTLQAVGLNPNAGAQPRFLTRAALRRVRLLSASLVAALLLSSGTWLLWIDQDPNVAVPTPAMPAQNAFTYFVDAGSQLMDEIKVSDALTARHVANGSRASASAVSAPVMSSGVPSMMAGSGRPSTDPKEHVYTLAEKAALVTENGTALAKLRQGLAYPYLAPPARSFSALFPYDAKYRSLARLLALDAEVKSQRGDWAGAMQSSLDAIALGRRVSHGSVLIGKWVGIACEAIGRKGAWNAIDHLTGAQARDAAFRLERIREDRVTMADTLTEEKWMATAGLQEMMRKPRWRWGADSLIQASPEDPGRGPSAIERVESFLVLLPFSKRTILANYEQMMNAQIDSARRPYFEQRGFQPPEPSDPMNRVLGPVFSQAGLKDTDDETQNALLQVALAVRAYRLNHGALPANLADLTPAYMHSVPADLFAPRTVPLQYRTTADKSGPAYLLYSVGPDGYDNSGTPISDPQAKADSQRHQVRAESVGDIVAGVNRD